jgi:hypothetical protein
VGGVVAVATASVYNLFVFSNMPAGATWSYEWRNLPNYTSVPPPTYSADINPAFAGSYQAGYDGVVTAEFTYQRRWRSTNHPQLGYLEYHYDALGTITNLGPSVANIAFSVVSFA